MRFIDLFAGLGGFHRALSSLGHECVFASELDPELRALYGQNFPDMTGKIFGDIRGEAQNHIPAHDFLCAGFPCQPFSKSGRQLGVKDETRGTLFHEILQILERHMPTYVLLENVGNFGRHDGGRTWRIVKDSLERLGYHVAGTEHVTPLPQTDWRDRGLERRTPLELVDQPRLPPGNGLISPHHFGFPHHRERFYIYATTLPLPESPFPRTDRAIPTTLETITQPDKHLLEIDRLETRLTVQQTACIDHWNRLLKALPNDFKIPGFPLWGDELDAQYPYLERTPWASRPKELGETFSPPLPKYSRKATMLELLPKYAREEVPSFRNWKIKFIHDNREWWKEAAPHLSAQWRDDLFKFPPSLRKLEWNVKGGDREIWNYVLQFRPSGLRVKRYTTSPALIAMTESQIPILGPKRRFLSRTEGKALQGFAATHRLPESRPNAFKALGNAVHVGVVQRLAAHLIEITSSKPLGDLHPHRKLA